MIEHFHWRKIIHAICLDRRILGSAACLYLAAAGAPHAETADGAPPSAATPRDQESERQPRTRIVSGSKTDRLPPPENVSAAMAPSALGARAEHRVEQAFADISRLEVALRRDERPAAAVAIAALRPPTARFEVSAELLAAGAAAPLTPVQPAADPASAFAFALPDEDRTATRESAGGGRLTMPAPPEAWDGSTASIPASDEAGISLPNLPSEIPVPTPRPSAPPAAAQTPDPPAEQAIAAVERKNLSSGHEGGSRSSDDHAEQREAKPEAPAPADADPEPQGSDVRISLPANLLPADGKHKAQSAEPPPPMTRIPGTPQEAVTLCGVAAAKAARVHGRADVTATSYGRTRQLADGGYLAPVMMRITYELHDGQEVRQGTVWCHFDRHGAINDLSEMTG